MFLASLSDEIVTPNEDSRNFYSHLCPHTMLLEK